MQREMMRKWRSLTEAFPAILRTAFLFFTAIAVLAGITAASAGNAFAAEKPEVSAEGAALYNVSTGEFLYEKNADQQFYPASITKLMTALLTLENTDPDDIVVFTDSATKNLESGAVSLDVTTGDQIPVRDCLYGLLLKSANEVANGLAEHVSGSISAFADLMNARAAELGCTHTHFVNPNGLNDAQHLTTPRDMCFIAAACFARADFCEYEKSISYHFPATINRPNGTNIVMGHKMMQPNDSRYYEGILGGKTGYTRLAGNTLVTCAERNGVRLIAVVMKCKGTHYTDTKALLDYGFAVAGDGAENGVSAESNSAAAGESTVSAASGSGSATAGTVQASESGAALIGPGAELSGTETSAAGTTVSGTSAAGASAAAGSDTVSPDVVTETASSEIVGNAPESGASSAGEAAESTEAGTAAGTSSAAAEGTDGSTASVTPSGSGVSAGWQKNGDSWVYYKADGKKAAGERLTINGFEYWFDSDGSMATGWRQDSAGYWYWLRPSFGGMKKNGWIETGGKYYYLGEDGRLLVNTTTPDGYRVNADGAWIS